MVYIVSLIVPEITRLQRISKEKSWNMLIIINVNETNHDAIHSDSEIRRAENIFPNHTEHITPLYCIIYIYYFEVNIRTLMISLTFEFSSCIFT